MASSTLSFSTNVSQETDQSDKFKAFSKESTVSPLFKNSVASNDIDFITADDKTIKSTLMFLKNDRVEMPGNLHTDDLFDNNAYVYSADFVDNTSVGIRLSSDFSSKTEARKYGDMLLGPLGKLPFKMRQTLKHVVIHKGDRAASAEDKGNFFIMHSTNMETRISNHDLEETVFHESVHATLDVMYEDTEEWLLAQIRDKNYITEYAERKHSEDHAESALFIYTYLYHPERLSEHVKNWMKQNIPNKINHFKQVFEIVVAK